MMLPISRFKRYHPVGMVTSTTPWLNITGDPTPPLLYLASWSGATYQATPPPVFYPPAVWIPDHTHLIQWECPTFEVVPLFPPIYCSSPLHPLCPLPKEPTVFQRQEKHPRMTNQIIQRTGGHDPSTRQLLCPSTLSGHVTSKANNTRDAKPNKQSSSSPLPSQHLFSTSPCHLPILSAPLTGGVSWEWAGLHRWRDKEAWPIILSNQRFRRARLKPLANLEGRLCSTLQLSCVPVSQLCVDKWPVLPVKVMKDIHPSLFSSKFSSRFTLLTNCRQQKQVIHGGKVSFKKGLLRKDRMPEKNQQGVTVSLFKDEDKDEDDGEDSRKDKRPVASSPVPGSPWCVVWTGDDRIFFFNPTIQLSVWERPGELTGQDISHIIQDPPHKRKKTSPVDRNCHSPDLHGDGEDDDDEGEHTSKRNRTEEPMSLIHRTDLKLLPLERRITHFREMMLERGVSAFSSWEKELHKMVFDPRYLLLTLEQRKQVFDKFVKSRVKDEYKEKKSKLHKAREEFKQLLNEAKMSSRSTFKEFCVRYHGDWRFNGLSQKKEQEVLFNHYITSLKKRDKENRAKLRKMR